MLMRKFRLQDSNQRSWKSAKKGLRLRKEVKKGILHRLNHILIIRQCLQRRSSRRNNSLSLYQRGRQDSDIQMRKFPLHIPSWHGMRIGEKSAEKGNKENSTQIKAYINKIITFVFAGIYRQVTTETVDKKKNQCN